MENESYADKVFAFVIGLSGFQAYGAILAVLFACGLGLPVPEDITLFAAGFLAFKGRITLTGALAVGLIGVLVGDTFMYWIGRRFGRSVLLWPVFRRVFTASRIKRAENKIQKNAKLICFTARFAPGLRAPVYLTSGILRVSFPTFFLMDGLAALISVPVWVCLAYLLGDKIEEVFVVARTAKQGIVIVFAILIVYFIISRIRKWIRKKELIKN